MASWLKVAEDLFENMDRKAKLVATELSDESSDLQPPASNGQGSEPKKMKSRIEGGKKLSNKESPQASNVSQELTCIQMPQLDSASDNDRATLSVENEETLSSKTIAQTSTENPQDAGRDVTVAGVDSATSTSNVELLNEKDSDVPVEHPPPLPVKETQVVKEDHPIDDVKNIKLGEADVPVKTDQEKSQSTLTSSPVRKESSLKGADLEVEPLVSQKKQLESKADTSPMTVQDQLDEAQGLLKIAVSSGQSKEARLARACAGLQSRLQEYKSENAQLEELLTAERELTKSYEGHIKQLQKDLSISKNEVARIESNMAEALAVKNSEIEALVSSMETSKKQLALSEGNLASMQANMESIMRNRELTETRMMQALREELASAERRAEEERTAHNATKMAAMEREVELEHRAIETSTALAKMQRIADERTTKAAELEQKVALLEIECASLNQELQDMEARACRGQKKSPEEANQMIQAWQEEVERARQGQRDAESKLSYTETEAQKMRVEMAAMKRDAEHYSRQEHVELEKRYRELTDLLYYKQTQLEAMASEKAAAEFQLEKEVKRLQEAQVEAERNRVSRRTSSSWEEDNEMKELDNNCRPLPLYHRQMVGASMQLQKAAKILDSGAARVTRFLWRYPTARLILLFYLVFVHLFLMYLLHRLQEQADSFSAREVAESMGLANHTLP
ncbi:PREDICTED: golgin candidate 1 isoform X2 [Populus euphratica]|uniref:Golgin candidate 1 isoform X2 n=1 Tax=Populus euphratica TaxID=75702 RepID=A0AAJ6VIT2_POPEU|nr:PREDICTED: golgin candidate 1 isoform X2 [Populus euphratica]